MRMLLRNIAEIQSGVYLKTSPSPNVLYLQVNDFDSEGVILSTTKPTVLLEEKNRNHILNYGDLLFAAKGNKNFSTIFTECEYGCVASSSFLVVRITKKDIVIPEYLNWYLNLPRTIEQLSINAVGTSIPSITKAMLEEVELRLPSIEVQKKVVDIAGLQKQEQRLLAWIATRRQILIDNKLKQIIENGD